MTRPISQREARRLRKRVDALESADRVRRNRWAATYPGGTHIATMAAVDLPKSLSAVETARNLQHAVVVTTDGNNVLFYALPVAETQ